MTPQDIHEKLLQIVDIPSKTSEKLALLSIIEEAWKAGIKVGLKDLQADLKSLRAGLHETAKEESLGEVEAAIERLNAEFYIKVSSTKVRVGRMTPKIMNGQKFFEHHEYSKDDFKLLYENELVAGRSVAEWWLEAPGRRVIAGTFMSEDHEPMAIVDGRLNLWQGFSVEPLPGDYGWFTKHLFRLVRKDAEAFSYLLRWLAWCVQHPTERIGTMVILIGGQGAGKGAIGNVMRSIFGPHGTVVDNREHLVGRFTQQLKDACFVFIDEPPFAGSKADADKLKHMITEPTISIEAKYKDPEEVDNRLKMMAATNHDHAAHLDPDDRRHAVLECAAPSDVGDANYFREYWEKAQSATCKAAVLHFLMTLDLAEWDPAVVPRTEITGLQKSASLTGDMAWWRLVLEGETWSVGRSSVAVPVSMTGIEGSGGGNEIDPKKTEVYGLYRAWHFDTGKPGNPTNDVHFWRNFRKWASDEFIRTYRPSNQPFRVKLKTFPEMRERFEGWLRSGKRLP